MAYIYNMVDTWNASGTTYTGIGLNVTDTASASGSLLMDLQVGAASKFSVSKTGQAVSGFNSVSAATYSFSGDTTTGWGYRTTGTLSAVCSNTETLRISSSGVDSLNYTIGASNGGRLALGTAATFDVFLSRKAAANLQFGAANAAAPVAQTLSVQSVVAGTTDTAGANLTITGSQGTGTGAGGDIIFQVAPASTTGSTQNTLATALRVYNTKTVSVGVAYTVATLPTAGTQGRRAWVTDATVPTFLGTLTGGGAVVCPVFDNGTAWVSA